MKEKTKRRKKHTSKKHKKEKIKEKSVNTIRNNENKERWKRRKK